MKSVLVTFLLSLPLNFAFASPTPPWGSQDCELISQSRGGSSGHICPTENSSGQLGVNLFYTGNLLNSLVAGNTVNACYRTQATGGAFLCVPLKAMKFENTSYGQVTVIDNSALKDIEYYFYLPKPETYDSNWGFNYRTKFFN